MINPKELRLGNYVQDRGGKTIRIDFMEHVQEGYSTKFGQVVSEGFHPLTAWTDYAEPIPLTEDILLKCGFTKEISEGNDWMRLCYNDFVFDTDESIQFSAVELNHKGYSIFNCEFLHELQNAYFLVTKEELKINL